MNNPHFTFPPPPPPPPQASGNYNVYPHDSSGQQGPNGRGRGGGRGHGGKGRGHGRGGQRGGHASGYGGYPSVNQRQTDGPYNQPSNFGGNYPLPDYPVVQQPQYPASVHNAYAHPPSPYSQQAPYSNHPPSSYSGYPANGYRAAPTYGAHDESQRYEQDPSATFPRDPRRAPKHSPSNQPIIMPPIRVGRDGRGGILRTQATQSPPVQYDYGPPAHNMYQEAPPNIYQQNRYDQSRQSQGNRGRGHRRGHSDAIHQPHNPDTSRQVAPAVPSFGAPFPGDMSWRPHFQPASRESSNKPKKKKRRRHNQLGLTPKTEDHESSEEDDDQDEELKLQAAVGAGLQQLVFTYEAQTSTAWELAAWIAERKKRFPTKARAAEAAERKKQDEETQRLARQAAQESQKQQRAEARKRHEEQKAEAKEKPDKQKAATNQKHDQPLKIESDQKSIGDKDTAALKARLKVEKLRKRLEKEEKRIAKAEAKASRATEEVNMPTNPTSLVDNVFENKKRKRTDSFSGLEDDKVNSEESIEAEPPQLPPGVDTLSNETRPILSAKEKPKEIIDAATDPTGPINQEPNIAQNPLTPTSQPSIPDTNHPAHILDLSGNHPPSAVPNSNGANDETMEDIDVSNGDSDSSLSEDSSHISSSDEDNESTSSEGSSSSSNDAPETAPSKRDGPVRVPPPKRENPNATKRNICRHFLKSGRCPRGEKCRFRHELPEKGSGSPVERKGKVSEPKKGRKGLYQRLVEQEQEQDDQQALAAIIQLGEQGLLAPPTANGISGGS